MFALHKSGWLFLMPCLITHFRVILGLPHQEISGGDGNAIQ